MELRGRRLTREGDTGQKAVDGGVTKSIERERGYRGKEGEGGGRAIKRGKG